MREHLSKGNRDHLTLLPSVKNESREVGEQETSAHQGVEGQIDTHNAKIEHAIDRINKIEQEFPNFFDDLSRYF
jgi:hypothetical protein